MPRRLIAVLLVGALSLLLLYSVAGSSVLSGPLLFTFTATHGVHRSDLIALAAWSVGVVCVIRLLRP